MDRINAAIRQGAPMSLPQILRKEIDEFKASEAFQHMTEAERYYRNLSDVQNKHRKTVKRSNTKLEHPLYKKLVDQKADYLLSKPFSVESENKAYSQALGELFDRAFRRRIKSLGKGGVKCGIAYLAPYIEDGAVRWMRLPSTEVIPEWADEEHTRLDAYIRFYEQVEYVCLEKKTVEKVEFWSLDGVQYFKADEPGGILRPDEDLAGQSHLTIDGQPHNWERVPLVWCKYNEEELPLSYFVKYLIDDYNWQSSVTADVLRDVAKFVWVIKNYDDEPIEDFLLKIEDASAIKVSDNGGVDKLEPDPNIDAVMKFLDKNRRDLFDLAANVDTKDPDLGNASGTAILFRYMGLDTDCTNLAAELQETFENMKPFLDFALQISGKGDFSKDSFNVVFNMDMPVNEAEVIQSVMSSRGLVSDRTLLAQHPYVTDVDEELKQLEEEKQKAMEDFGGDLFADLHRTPSNGGGVDEP